MGPAAPGADVNPRNHVSARLQVRLGFVQEGLLRLRWGNLGEVYDSAPAMPYGLLRSDAVGPAV